MADKLEIGTRSTADIALDMMKFICTSVLIGNDKLDTAEAAIGLFAKCKAAVIAPADRR